jgi:hypothetical protein
VLQVMIIYGERTRPIICTPRASNSGFSFAKAPSSVVQTGVKSAGCEKSMVHLLFRNLWKSRSPCVVFAWKLGAIRYSISPLPYQLDFFSNLTYLQSLTSILAAQQEAQCRDGVAGQQDAGSSVWGVQRSAEHEKLHGGETKPL